MKTIERIALVVALVLAFVALFLPASQSTPAVVTPQGLTFGTSNFGGSIAVAGDATVVGTVSGGSVSGATVTGNTVAATTLTLGGQAFSGTIHYGAASAYVTGTAISTGFATTATVCGLLGSSSAISASINISSSTAFSITFPNGTTPTVYWLCGK